MATSVVERRAVQVFCSAQARLAGRRRRESRSQKTQLKERSRSGETRPAEGDENRSPAAGAKGSIDNLFSGILSDRCVLSRRVRVTILGSGSEGNATVFESGKTRVLFDAGLSLRRIRRRYQAAHGRPLEHLDGIVVTHSHGDHVSHVARVAKIFDAPVFMQAATAKCMKLESFEAIEPSHSFTIGALSVHPRRVPHDVPQVALVVRDGDDCVGLATDLGYVSKALAADLGSCRTLLLESNHCRKLLAAAPYPMFVKERISSSRGHLANTQCARLLKHLAKPPLERVVLMHLSQKANSPEKARRIARAALGKRIDLFVARQDEPLVLEERAPRQLSLAL